MGFGLAGYVVVRSSQGHGNRIGAARVFGSVSRNQRKSGDGIMLYPFIERRSEPRDGESMRWLARKLCEQPAISRLLHWLGRRVWIAATGKDPLRTERNYREAILQWASDDSYLEDVCVRVGCTEKEACGDSYGVPDIQDKVDMIVAKLQQTPTAEMSHGTKGRQA